MTLQQTALRTLYVRATVATANHEGENTEQIETLWTDIHTGVDVTDPTNFSVFLSNFIEERYRETADEERSDAICGCGNPMCNPMNGKLPPEMKPSRGRFKQEPVTPETARRYLDGHSECHVIRDALDEWSQMVGETKGKLSQIINLTKSTQGVDFDEDNIPAHP